MIYCNLLTIILEYNKLLLNICIEYLYKYNTYM